MLWMQPDGTLHPSATQGAARPVRLRTLRTGWRDRSGRSAKATRPSETPTRPSPPSFAARLELALDALDREVLVRYGTHRLFDGANIPAWLIVDGADAIVRGGVRPLGLHPRRPGMLAARLDLGVLPMAWPRWRCRTRCDLAVRRDPARTRARVALARMGRPDGGCSCDGRCGARRGPVHEGRGRQKSSRFTPHLLRPGRRRSGLAAGARPSCAQIAYGADATLQNLLRTADATGLDRLPEARRVAGGLVFRQ